MEESLNQKKKFKSLWKYVRYTVWNIQQNTNIWVSKIFFFCFISKETAFSGTLFTEAQEETFDLTFLYFLRTVVLDAVATDWMHL